MTETEFKYWAFLCYSQQDNCEIRPDAPDARWLRWGDWLHNVIETFSIPADFARQINARGEIIPERLFPIFQDSQEHATEAGLSTEVRQALEQSKCLILICSPRSAQSLHVNEAVRYFKQLGRGNRILPFVIAGEPNASEGKKTDVASDLECFVPALRHPVNADGTLDSSQRDRGPIYADARIGGDKREMLAQDSAAAETELEIAKIQLVSGLMGVGFNGLWSREQKRRFAEAQRQAREAQRQVAETRRQLEEALQQVRAAQDKALEAQNLPGDVQSQIQESQNKTFEAQSQAREALNQFHEAQHKAQALQSQLDEARDRVQAAERKILELENQTREARRQAEAAEQQLQEARKIVAESPKESPADLALVAEENRRREEIQAQAIEAQEQLREAQHKAQALQSQLDEARDRVSASEKKILELESQTREVRERAETLERQLQEAQKQLTEAPKEISVNPDLVAAANHQVEALQNQFRQAELQVQESRRQTVEAQEQARDARRQAEESQRQLQEARNEVQELLLRVQEAQGQAEVARDEIQKIRSRQTAAVGDQVQPIQRQSETARRLTKVFAVLAALALLAGGFVAGGAWRQRKTISSPADTELASGEMNRERIQEALQAIDASQPEKRLNNLAGQIPAEKIPDALQASSVIPDDSQRCQFQKLLLVRLAETNPVPAMNFATDIDEKNVGANGRNDLTLRLAVLERWAKTDVRAAFDWVRQQSDAEIRGRALAMIIPALAADSPTNTLALLADLKPAPDKSSYEMLFRHWATNDPVQAIAQRHEIPGGDAEDAMLCTIVSVWANHDPDAAWNWSKAQPDSASKNNALAACISEQAKADFAKALGQAESLPVGPWRDAVIVGLFQDWAKKDLDVATVACEQLAGEEAKEKAWECVLNQRIANDPASAAGAVTNLPPGDYRQKAISALCEHWAGINTGTNAPAVLAWAQALPSDAERLSAINVAVAKWADKDPQSASQFAGQHPELSGETVGAIATSWVESDFPAATNWVVSLPDDSKKSAAISALVETWAKTDPKGLGTYALSLSGDLRKQCMAEASQQLAIRDWPATVELLQSLPDENLRQEILEQAARGCDARSLNSAAQYIIAMSSGADQKAAIRGLLSNWTQTDPETAVRWLNSFPETNAQPEQVQSVVKAWAQSEPAAAAKWLATVPADQSHEAELAAFLQGAVEKFPEYAAQWTQSVTNADLRQKFEIQVARQWLKTNASAAAAWLDSLDLPAETKAALKAQ